MEYEPNFLQDRRPQLRPIEQIEDENRQLLETARIELEQIKESLKDFMQRIVEEKPDMLVFLDKGARLFAGPITQYLVETHPNQPRPDVRFYNDSDLKNAYLHDRELDGVVNQDFTPFTGKKIFFIDETFSAGKGAGALMKAIEQSGVDGYYFSLSQNTAVTDFQNPNEEYYELGYQKHQKVLDQGLSSGRLHIYPNKIDHLFSKQAAELYVTDDYDNGGKTSGRYKLIPKGELDQVYDYSEDLIHARNDMQSPSGIDWKEYDQKVRESNRETVVLLRKQILDVLKAD